MGKKRSKLEGDVIDFEEVFGAYIGKDLYLAISEDYSEVIASGRNISEAVVNSEKKGYNDPIIMRAPDEYFGNLILSFS